eukprot:3798912-Amphidinium_carterae.1
MAVSKKPAAKIMKKPCTFPMVPKKGTQRLLRRPRGRLQKKPAVKRPYTYRSSVIVQNRKQTWSVTLRHILTLPTS